MWNIFALVALLTGHWYITGALLILGILECN